jgi:hypothetical protein
MKIDAKTVDAIKLPAGRSEVIVYDDEIAGFGVRVREGGRVFVFTYKVAGKTRRLTLGAAAKEAFPDIRKRALDLQAQVRLGNDPAAERQRSKPLNGRRRSPSRRLRTFTWQSSSRSPGRIRTVRRSAICS